MKAVYFENGRAAWRERPVLPLDEGEVRLQVLLTGICHTDIELLGGYQGFSGVPGHEFVGLIVEAPADRRLLGRRAVVEINRGCGRCPICLAGEPRHCPERRVLGIRDWAGAMAEYVTAPLANVHLVDDSIRDEEAVFVEPLAAALRLTEQVSLAPSMRLAVLGDGKLGLLIALALKAVIPDVLLLGRHDKKLALASAQGVAGHKVSLDLTPSELAARLGQFDLVVEATGRPDGLAWAMNLTRTRGTIVAKTTLRSQARLDLADLVVREITLVGSRCGSFPAALAALKEKKLDVRPLIEAVYPFWKFDQALDHARRPGTLKILIRPES
ncbi:MAG: alcohol dehydrogenase catalytic domain-containing protein [Thermodesulfobacteriota bacterium]